MNVFLIKCEQTTENEALQYSTSQQKDPFMKGDRARRSKVETTAASGANAQQPLNLACVYF